MSGNASIGVNLRVTGHCNQGGRKYNEDVFTVAYQQTEDEKDLEYAYFGIFDGHGGKDAALFAKEHLMDNITKQKNFWSTSDECVLKAIKEGFLLTQQQMWKDLPSWRKTASGLPSTAGTTASICFIKRGKIFIGHVGDSGIVLGQNESGGNNGRWKAKPLTRDHKPECPFELKRIQESGGRVVNKSGVPRVVWYRPRGGPHVGPVGRSTPIDEIPFLAVARALGDLWSYNAEDDVFIVSPEPDLHVYPINILKDRCLILATDGAWNVLTPDATVCTAHDVERNNEKHMIDPNGGHGWINPSKRLVDSALDRWNMCKLRADNVSILTVMLDPPGPPRAQVLRRLHGVQSEPQKSVVKPSPTPPELPPKPKAVKSVPPPPSSSSLPLSNNDNNGIAIISRFPNSTDNLRKKGRNLVGKTPPAQKSNNSHYPSSDSMADSGKLIRVVHDSMDTGPRKMKIDKLKSGEEETKNKVQYNEVSSSAPPLPERKGRKSLNRELAGLKNGRRSVSSEGYNSDAENQPRTRSASAAASSSKPPAPPPKIRHRRSEAALVTKTSPIRVLRSHQNNVQTPSHAGVKRKLSSNITNSAPKILKTVNGGRKRSVTFSQTPRKSSARLQLIKK